jgi:hypothetical protein
MDVLRARLVTQTRGTLKASHITKFGVSFTQMSWRSGVEKINRWQSTIQQAALRRNADSSDIVILEKQTCHAKEASDALVFLCFIYSNDRRDQTI